MNYALHLAVFVAIYSLAASSLNLVVGYGGLLSLAHAAQFAVGAYAFALLSSAASLPDSASLVLALLAGALTAPVLALAAQRFRGDFFVMASLAWQALVYAVALNWWDIDAPLGSWRNLTNGSFGIALGATSLSGLPPALLPALAATLIGIGLLGLLTRAPWGRLLQATRDDEALARGLGKGVTRLKLELFVVSGALSALAGALYAWHVRYVDPSLAGLPESILVLAMVLLGGPGRLVGPLLGAVVLVLLPELLRALGLPPAMAANLRALLFGALLVLLLHLRPHGLLAGRRRS